MADDVSSTVNPTPAASGNTVSNSEVAELRARNEQLEREKQGIFNDLKAEREKRQLLERSQLPAASTNGVSNQVADDPSKVLNSVVQPLYEELNAVKLERDREKALRWLAKQEKVDPDEIQNHNVIKELNGVIQKYSLGNAPLMEGVKAAYTLLLQERSQANNKSSSNEENQAKVVEANSTTSSVSAVPAGSKVVKVSRADIAKMSPTEYYQLKERAAKSGEQIRVE